MEGNSTGCVESEADDMFIPQLGKMKHLRFNEELKEKPLLRKLHHRIIFGTARSKIQHIIQSHIVSCAGVNGSIARRSTDEAFLLARIWGDNSLTIFMIFSTNSNAVLKKTSHFLMSEYS